MAQLLDERYRIDLEPRLVESVERPDAGLAQDHLAVAVHEYVLGCEQELLHGGTGASTHQNRAVRAAHLAQEVEILHVAAPDLEEVGELRRRGDLARIPHLDGQSESMLVRDVPESAEGSR